jgi:hypothetical protein
MLLFSEAFKIKVKYLALVLFLGSLFFLGFVPEQSDFLAILTGFAVAFLSYFLLIKKTSFSVKQLLIVSIVVRFVMIFAFPNLSDDIYRFIWDGKLLHLGQNPFEYLPSEYVEGDVKAVFHDLLPLLNSPDYYSIYPPFAQLIFYLSTFSWMDSAIVIKLLLLLAEISTIYFSYKLLLVMGLKVRNVLWYTLNPLIIIEIMVNIHFEGFMVLFFVMFLYFLRVNALNKAAIAIALAIGAKLVPLLFLPYFLFHWTLKKAIIFYAKVGFVLLLLFMPMLLQLGGFTESLDLYFRKFEFNASIYYVLREIGEIRRGYNMIGKIGPGMAIAVFMIVMFLAYKTKDFVNFSLLALTVFLLLSTTVHPWYIALGVVLSTFIKPKYAILWSGLIILSYAKYGLSETWYYLLVAIEYITLFTYMFIEWKRQQVKTLQAH